jgi:multiple sugar transport system permease protein
VIGYGLIAPSAIGITLFLIAPIVIVVWLSFQHWDLIGPIRFVGLNNWTRVLSTPGFWGSVLVTLVFVVLVIPLLTVLGLLMATLLARRLPGSGIFRVIFVVPWVCAPLALGVVWNWIFQPTGGALNDLLHTHIPWLTEPALALPAVALVNIWSQVGYVTLFFLAGLAVIPDQILEAAKMDGASAGRIFWSIKMPLMRSTLFFVLVTNVIWAFQVFDSIYGLTPQGGPNGTTSVISFRIYQTAFAQFDMGDASVTAVVLFVVLILVTVAQQLYFRKRITYDLS